METWAGEDGKNYGKYILRGTDMENFDMGTRGELLSFKSEDGSYEQKLNIRSLDPNKLFPESQQSSKSRHMSILVEPIQFIMHPASKVIAKPGSDLQIQMQFIYKDFLKNKSKSGKGDSKMKVTQTGFQTKENTPYFTPWWRHLYEHGENAEYFTDVEAQERYSVEFWEEDLGNNKVQVFLNLIIEDVKSKDQSFLKFEVEKYPMKHVFNTELVVEPNTEMFPEGYLGVWMPEYNMFLVKPEEEGAPYMVYRGHHFSGFCAGIGKEISNVYVTKDGQRLDSSTHGRFQSEKRTGEEGTVQLEFSIANLTDSDAGDYSCVVEGPSGSVQQDMSLIVADYVGAELTLLWWNATMVSCIFLRDCPIFQTDFKILTALGIFRPHPPTLKS